MTLSERKMGSGEPKHGGSSKETPWSGEHKKGTLALAKMVGLCSAEPPIPRHGAEGKPGAYLISRVFWQVRRKALAGGSCTFPVLVLRSGLPSWSAYDLACELAR